MTVQTEANHIIYGSTIVLFLEHTIDAVASQFHAPAVVVTIMSLFFLSGITTAVEDVMLKTIRLPGVLSLWSKYDDNVYRVAHLDRTVPDNLTDARIISDYVPVRLHRPKTSYRHPILTLHIVNYSPFRLDCIHTHVGLIKSGTMIMTIIGIWEYSSKKNKLTYMIANAGVWQMTNYIPKTEFYRAVLGIDSLYFKVIAVLLGVVCLGWTLQWPETPVWLASKEKTEESKTAFLWLHGEEELQNQQSTQAPQDSNVHPKLYSFSLLVLIFTITIYKTTVWYKSYKATNTSTDFISNELKTGLLICTSIFVGCCTVVIMKNIKRTFTFLTILGLTAVFYIFACLGGPLVTALKTVGAHPMLRPVVEVLTETSADDGADLSCSSWRRLHRSSAHSNLPPTRLPLTTKIQQGRYFFQRISLLRASTRARDSAAAATHTLRATALLLLRLLLVARSVRLIITMLTRNLMIANVYERNVA
ncbi:hypothetical protein MSG28_012644 [Choristoneura fumiferana]|uniref:Uncharacterized protein n=1 Tax=Choristoneura fumiferana TaxID=7141 RepID=A0ACC0JHG0_CHOFU|nr:hypothetical protein MSG28_012644 [Choristoneura fumiferana]